MQRLPAWIVRDMEQYYIATAEGKTEGPYSFENLEVQCNCGMINPETLVCAAGGQEWTEFKTILSQKGKSLPDRHKVEEVRKKLYDPSWASSKEPQEVNLAQKPLTEITVEGLFKVVGILALIVGFILALCHTGPEYGTIGFIYLVSGVFSCLGCFWCAKVITLLSRTVNLLSALTRNSFSDKQ